MQSFQDYRKNREPKIPSDSSPDENIWKKWRSFINVPVDGIPESIRRMAQDSPTFEEAVSKWTNDDWKSCRNQIGKIESIRRMRERMVGNPFERDGKPTGWMKSLLEKGHDPRKH